ncbi:MAG: hypothetical protein INR69_02565 [Mucilaginibacter polytrichastri]|nr:hypothetical protein [Mucilaginibacter polytrichastri]
MKNYLMYIGAGILVAAACNYGTRNTAAHAPETTIKEQIINPQPKNLIGLWLENNPDRIYANNSPGYEFHSNGTLKPVNISTLGSGKWELSGDQLKLAVQTAEKSQTDTLRYRIEMNNELMMLTAIGEGETQKELYIRAR